jgi:hypothetical protein
MEIYQRVNEINSRHDLVEFIQALRDHLLLRGDTWENPTLESFLEALAAWSADMDGFFQNRGEQVPLQPSWRLIGQMLLAATVYE